MDNETNDSSKGMMFGRGGMTQHETNCLLETLRSTRVTFYGGHAGEHHTVHFTRFLPGLNDGEALVCCDSHHDLDGLRALTKAQQVNGVHGYSISILTIAHLDYELLFPTSHRHFRFRTDADLTGLLFTQFPVLSYRVWAEGLTVELRKKQTVKKVTVLILGVSGLQGMTVLARHGIHPAVILDNFGT